MSGDKPKAGPPRRDPTGPTPPTADGAKAGGFLPNADTEADVIDPAALRAALGKPEKPRPRSATARAPSPTPRGPSPTPRTTTSRGETPAPRTTTARGASPEPPAPERPTNPSGFDPNAVFNPGDAVTTVGVIDPALLKALLARNSEPPDDPVVSDPAPPSRSASAGALLGRAGRVSAPPAFGGDTEMADLAALEADISARHQQPKLQGEPAAEKSKAKLDAELAAAMALAAEEVERPKGAAPPKVTSSPDRPAVPPPPKPGAPPKTSSSPDRPAAPASPAEPPGRPPLAPPRLDSDLQRVMASAAASVEIESPDLGAAVKRPPKPAKGEPRRAPRGPKAKAGAEERRSYGFEIALVVLVVAAVGAELKLHLSWPTLELTSRPTPATVLLHDVAVGTTPLALKLEPGVDHRLVLQADDRPDTVRRVLLSRFERSELVVDLEVAQRFVVAPGPVEVFVNERSIGRGQKVRLPTLKAGEAVTIRVEHEERVVLERSYGGPDEVEDEIVVPGL